MGLVGSRQSRVNNEEDAGSILHYKYRPKTGAFFGSTFMMGGERFECTQPEAYLFGDNCDLHFIESTAEDFPYPSQSTSEPTQAIQSYVHIRRDSLRFSALNHMGKDSTTDVSNLANGVVPDVKVDDDCAESSLQDADVDIEEGLPNNNDPSTSWFTIQFSFDCDLPCFITVYFFAMEHHDHKTGVSYLSKKPDICSKTYHYDMGAAQLFSHSELMFNPAKYTLDELLYDYEQEIIPVVIHCVVDNPDNTGGYPQSHATLAYVEPSNDGTGYVLKPLKQKLFVDGLAFLLQEIYGIENKHGSDKMDDDGGAAADEYEADTAECVVCMSELRDTLMLPCRHLCLCYAPCAETLRYKASNCPICRSPFRALLQLKAFRKTKTAGSSAASGMHMRGTTGEQGTSSSTSTGNGSGSSCGGNYHSSIEPVPLVEALNGPSDHHRTGSLPRNPIPLSNSTALDVQRQQKSVPRPPPRGRQKKKARTVSPIQQVLTPAVFYGGGASSSAQTQLPQASASANPLYDIENSTSNQTVNKSLTEDGAGVRSNDTKAGEKPDPTLRSSIIVRHDDNTVGASPQNRPSFDDCVAATDVQCDPLSGREISPYRRHWPSGASDTRNGFAMGNRRLVDSDAMASLPLPVRKYHSRSVSAEEHPYFGGISAGSTTSGATDLPSFHPMVMFPALRPSSSIPGTGLNEIHLQCEQRSGRPSPNCDYSSRDTSCYSTKAQLLNDQGHAAGQKMDDHLETPESCPRFGLGDIIGRRDSNGDYDCDDGSPDYDIGDSNRNESRCTSSGPKKMTSPRTKVTYFTVNLSTGKTKQHKQNGNRGAKTDDGILMNVMDANSDPSLSFSPPTDSSIVGESSDPSTDVLFRNGAQYGYMGKASSIPPNTDAGSRRSTTPMSTDSLSSVSSTKPLLYRPDSIVVTDSSTAVLGQGLDDQGASC